MTDERLRELERKWKETGAVEDEVAYLAERVRSGELAKNRLELAAWLEHPAALLLLGMNPPDIWEDFEDYLKTLARWDRQVRIRLAIALALHNLHEWEQSHPGNREPHQTFKKMLDLLKCPCERHRRDCSVNLHYHEDVTLIAASYAAGAIAYPTGTDNYVYETLNEAVLYPHHSHTHEAGIELLKEGNAQARTILRFALRQVCEWVLDYGDPIVEQLERIQKPGS